MNKILAIILSAFVLAGCKHWVNEEKAQNYSAPKREFRGAWIQCVNGQFLGMGTQEMQKTLSYQLDELKKDGVNAIIFQVRPECDALYESPYEPWSRFLMGEQGVAPVPYWDPLEWMVRQCHAREMEIHAWINPFRAKTKNTNVLAPNHYAKRYPERCFSYDGLLIMNPALQENREFICHVAADIVRRYDVDGLHIDDYFYPYPAAGFSIPDNVEYDMYGQGMSRDDWRRENVNVFIRMLSDSIHQTKPWVKFGVSPFGIYRNKKSDPLRGSNTNGLQNYDDLYADVLTWVENGRIDYCVPQIYWQMGHQLADYTTLIEWWNKYAAQRPLFIGEDVERSVKFPDLTNPDIHQQKAKIELGRSLPNVKGVCLWYAKAVVDNVGNYGSLLRNKYFKSPALQPAMPFIDKEAPKKPLKPKAVWTSDGYMLFWTTPKSKKWNDEVRQFVVYQYRRGEKPDFEDPERIMEITSHNYVKLPYVDGKTKYTYYITSLDRLHNESVPVKINVKL